MFARKAWRHTRTPVLGLVGFLLFLGIWEILCRLEWVNPNMMAPPSIVAQTAWQMTLSGELPRHFLASIQRALLGYALGSALGIMVGLISARSTLFRELSDPLLQMFRAIPSLAFVPLAIFWFGIGEASKVFLITWGVFFPVWVNTFLGVRGASVLVQRAAASLGARGMTMLVRVVLPLALPLIIAGLRVSLAMALVILVAAELAGAMAGVGYLIQTAQLVFRIDQMFVGLFLLGILGMLADMLFMRSVRTFFPWYEAELRAARH